MCGLESCCTLIKKKRKFSSYIRKLRKEQLQSHIWLTAFSHIYYRKLFLIYDFVTAPLWNLKPERYGDKVPSVHTDTHPSDWSFHTAVSWIWNFTELLRNKLRFTWGWAEVLSMAHTLQIFNWMAWQRSSLCPNCVYMYMYARRCTV